jgi:hypothetical protein
MGWEAVQPILAAVQRARKKATHAIQAKRKLTAYLLYAYGMRATPNILKVFT